MKKIIAILAFALAGLAQAPVTTPLLSVTANTASAPVTGVSVSRVGNPGPQLYYYWVVAEFTIGNSAPSPFVVAPSSADPLSSSNYNRISYTPNPSQSANGYDVLRTTSQTVPSGACNCAVAIGTTSLSVNDQSNTLLSYTVNTWSGNTTFNVTNQAVGPGESQLTFTSDHGAKFEIDNINGAVLPSPTLSNITVTTATVAGVNETIKQKSGQTGDMLDLQSSAGSGGDLGSVDSAGVFQGITVKNSTVMPIMSAGAIYADQETGADWSVKVQKCITAAAANPARLCDARGLTGAQVVSVDIYSGIRAVKNWLTPPVTLLLGSVSVTCPTSAVVGSGCISVPSKQSIAGEDSATTFTLATGAGADVRTFESDDGAQNVSLSHFGINGNYPNVTGNGAHNDNIFLQDCYRCTAENMSLHDANGSGVQLWGGGPTVDAITTIARSANVATVTQSNSYTVGQYVLVAFAAETGPPADVSFVGLQQVATASSPSWTFSNSGSNVSYSTGYVAFSIGQNTTDASSAACASITSTQYKCTLTNPEIFPGTIGVTEGSTLEGTDSFFDQTGNISGSGVTGSCNYWTGACELYFASAPSSFSIGYTGGTVPGFSKEDLVTNSHFTNNLQAGFAIISGADWKYVDNFDFEQYAFQAVHAEPSSYNDMNQNGLVANSHFDSPGVCGGVSTTGPASNPFPQLQSGLAVVGNEFTGGYVNMLRTPHFSVTGNRLLNNACGFAILIQTRNGAVSGNTIDGYAAATDFQTNNAAIYVNDTSNNDTSNDPAGSGSVAVTGNSIDNFPLFGIWLENTSNDTVTGNTGRNILPIPSCCGNFIEVQDTASLTNGNTINGNGYYGNQASGSEIRDLISLSGPGSGNGITATNLGSNNYTTVQAITPLAVSGNVSGTLTVLPTYSGTVSITASSTALDSVIGTASIPSITTSMACFAAPAGTADADAFVGKAWVSVGGIASVEVVTRVTDASPGAITYNIRCQ